MASSTSKLDGAYIMREQFLLRETRVVARLRAQGLTEELRDLEDVFRVAKNAGARKVLLPLGCLGALQIVSPELMSSESPEFDEDGDVVAAARKALEL